MKRYTCNTKTYRSTSSYTRWGIFTNVNDWGDIRTLRCWYFNVHTPWRIVEFFGLWGD
jgi:hypothetical protein